jgi:hypothetical protein
MPRPYTRLIALCLVFTACSGEAREDDIPTVVDHVELKAPTPVPEPLAPPPLELVERVEASEIGPEPGPESEAFARPPVDTEPPRSLEVEHPQITVRHGESLYLLAIWAELRPEDIAHATGIDVTDTVFPGDPVVMPVEPTALAALEERRKAFALTRLDRWLNRRGGLVDVVAYTVQSGDSLWDIGRAQGKLPLWVITAFNQDRATADTLDALRVGDEILLPVTADMAPVAALDDAAAHEPAGPVAERLE